MIGIAELAAPIACAGLAVLLLARTRRNRIGGLAYAAVGTALLIASLKPASAVELVGAFVGAAVVAPLLGLAFRREPWLVAFLALACVPIRIGFLGHQLLVPLYVVALGAAAALLWDLAQGDERARELGRASWPLALFLVWTGLSMLWTVSIRTGVIDLLAFYIPFTIIAIAIARLPWQPSRLRILYGELAAMALIFAAVGFYQYETGTIFENPGVITENSYAAFFRVNSIFWDPSIYGRFLVVALVPTAVLIVRGRSLRAAVAAAAFAVVAWVGLLISFSESSFASLLVAVLLLAAVAWRWRALAAVVALVVVLGGLVAVQPKLMHAIRHHSKSELNTLTHGRASLIGNGIKIAKAHPALGVGLGGFAHAYSERTGRTPRKSASHDTPVTVAAEEGGLGLLLFLWLVGSFLYTASRRVRRLDAVGLVSLSAGVALAAIFVHSLAYNDFFEDPTTWMLFGLIALSAPRRLRARSLPPPPAEESAPVSEMIAT